MTPHLIVVTNPFAPAAGREILPLAAGIMLGAAVADHLLPGEPQIVVRNGAPVLRADWPAMPVEPGDAIVLVRLPQGGGGGGSNPMRLVLSIAIMAMSGPAATALLGQELAATTILGELTLGKLVGAAISVAGGMLVNALIPPPKPSVQQSAASLSMAAASPTYNLQAQGNAARLNNPIPVIYGQHRVYPDFGATPYTEYAGNEQFLYQLFVVGQGHYTIHDLKIEDTDIASFPEIETQTIGPGGTVTLFPTEVVTSVEVGGQEAEYNVALGPFTVNASGTLINAIAIDVACPKGLYYANDAGGLDGRTVAWSVEARLIDDAGLPLGVWTSLDAESITAATNTPQRRSNRYTVADGRYEVRLTRTNAKDASSRAGHDLNWVGLRGYLPGSQAYGDVTLLAVRARATNSLSSASARRFNCLVTRKLPTWSAVGGWTAPVATRSSAWATADMLRAGYGAGLADARINLAQLAALDSAAAARGDTFDAVFDARTTIWEAVTNAARSVRALAYQQGGIVHVTRDEAQVLPVAMFTPRNIVASSFKIEYLMPSDDTADCVEIEYFDAATWAPSWVMASLPASTADKPAKVKLFGVTGRAQSWREGMYMAACNRYRRRLVSFTTELDGMILSPGDLIAIAHDMPAWGSSGEILAAEGDQVGNVLTLTEPVVFGAGNHYIALARRDGTVSGPWRVVAGADDMHVILDQAITGGFTFDTTGSNRIRTRYTFGAADALHLEARVLALRPRSDLVEVSAVIEDGRVHTADGGAPPAPPAGWTLAGTPTVPVIGGTLEVVSDGNPDSPVVSLSWPAAAGATRYAVEQSFDNGGTWTRLADPATPGYACTTRPGAQRFRVAPMGAILGAWVEWAGTITGAAVAAATPAQLTGLASAVFQTTINLSWPAHGQAGIEYIEVFRNAADDSGSASRIAVLLGDQVTFADTIGVSNATRYYWIRAINMRGVAGPMSAETHQTTEAIGGAGGVEVVNSLPGTGNFEGRVCYLTTDDTIWRFDGTDWTAAVDGVDILANSITAQKLSIANLAAISANLGNITGGSLNIADKFIVDAAGNATIKSGATGARLEVYNNVIKVFDSAGTLRVKLGDLSA